MRQQKYRFGFVLTGAILALAPLALFFSQALPASAQALPSYRYTDDFNITSGWALTQAVATDSSNNVYQAGEFSGTINFAGNLGSDTQSSSIYDDFLTKHNADGSYGWTRILDTATNSGSANISGIATDSNGNVYITGPYTGSVIFDGPGGSNTYTTGGQGSYVSKYSSNGTYQWTKVVNPPNNSVSVGLVGIAIDSNNNIYLTGDFSGTINFGSLDNTTDNQADPVSDDDGFITKLNADGSYGWTKIFTPTSGSYMSPTGITVNQTDGVVVNGYFSGTVNFAGSSGTDNQTDAGGEGNSFVSEFSTAGAYNWTRSYDTTNGWAFPGNTIATDSNGNIFTAGAFSGTVNFAGSSGTDNQTDAGGNEDSYLTKYTSSGGYDYTRTYDTSSGGWSAAQAIAVDPNGGVYILSNFSGTVNFAGSSGTDTQTQSNSGAVTMYGNDGSYQWTQTFDPTNSSDIVTYQGYAAGLATDALGNLYVGSVFDGTATFDGPGGSDTITSSGSEDTFLTSFRTFNPIVVTTTTSSSSSSSSTSTKSSTTTAPDTGYGTPANETWLATGLFAIVLLLLGITIMILPRYTSDTRDKEYN